MHANRWDADEHVLSGHSKLKREVSVTYCVGAFETCPMLMLFEQ